MNGTPPSEPHPTGTRSVETRQLLLDAARQCVGEHGLRSATSRQITATAGANLAAITYHFGSKDQLIAEALFSEIERRVRPALAAFENDRGTGPADASSTLISVVQELLAEFERSKDQTLVYLEAILVATRDPEYRDRATELFAALRERLALVIGAMMADGVIPAWVDPQSMASVVLAAANGIVLQSQLDPDGPDHIAMATQFAGLLITAAQAPPG